MTITEAQYDRLREENTGYCTNCDIFCDFDNIFPDDEEAYCSHCGLEAAKGIDNAVHDGEIEIEKDTEDEMVSG